MNNKLTRDEVLDAFGAAAPWPTEALLRNWTSKYPEYEHDLVEFATAWAATALCASEPLKARLEDELVNRTMSRVQMLVRDLDNAAHLPAPMAASGDRLQINDLEQSLRARGVTGSWTQALGIDEFILALLDAHLIEPPVPRRLLDTLSRTLGAHVDAVRDWLFQDASPAVTSYAAKKPAFQRWTFRQAVEKSSLPEALKQQWIDEPIEP